MVYAWCNLIFGNQFARKFPPLGRGGGGKRRGWPPFQLSPYGWTGFHKKGFLVAYRPNKMGLGFKPNKPSSCSWVKPKPNLKTCLAHPIFAKGKVAVFGKHTLLPFSLALICPYFSI